MINLSLFFKKLLNEFNEFRENKQNELIVNGEGEEAIYLILYYAYDNNYRLNLKNNSKKCNLLSEVIKYSHQWQINLCLIFAFIVDDSCKNSLIKSILNVD